MAEEITSLRHRHGHGFLRLLKLDELQINEFE